VFLTVLYNWNICNVFAVRN